MRNLSLRSLAVGAAVAAAVVVAPAAPASAQVADLVITYQAAPTEPVVTWTLTCDPDGGSHPDPKGACERLATVTGDPFAPVPPGTICLPFSDGPDEATITGWWKRRPVDASFNRNTSCEQARWDNLVPVLPKV